MKAERVEYNSVHGTLHAVFFMGWVGHAFDYPSQALENFGPWERRRTGSVVASIDGSRGCEARA
jgi:hypothetical protein